MRPDIMLAQVGAAKILGALPRSLATTPQMNFFTLKSGKNRQVLATPTKRTRNQPGMNPELPGMNPEYPGTNPELSGINPEKPGMNPEETGFSDHYFFEMLPFGIHLEEKRCVL